MQFLPNGAIIQTGTALDFPTVQFLFTSPKKQPEYLRSSTGRKKLSQSIHIACLYHAFAWFVHSLSFYLKKTLEMNFTTISFASEKQE